MKEKIWLSVAVILCGLLILLVPDNGRRLFSYDEDHGPSFLDFIGFLLITNVWIYWIVTILNQRKKVYKKIRLSGVIITSVLLIAGLVLIIVGLQMENNAILYSGTALSVFTYVFLSLIALGRK
jgi:uncharacterized protein YjeT (DUF2065 family)